MTTEILIGLGVLAGAICLLYWLFSLPWANESDSDDDPPRD